MMSLWKNTDSSLILIVPKEQCDRICTVFTVPNGMASGSENMNSVPALFSLASQVKVLNSHVFPFLSTEVGPL